MEALKKEKNYYTYSDYLTWDDDARYELIDGVPYLMSPAPRQEHQEVSMEIAKQLAVFLTGKPCKVFAAPFDVRLNVDKADDTVVQPDILVVCDKSKLDGKSCNGAPDLVIEILSPSSLKSDRITKFNKYLQAGVREYWIVDPDQKTVDVYTLENGKYFAAVYSDTDVVPVSVLEGCEINLQDVFAE